MTTMTLWIGLIALVLTADALLFWLGYSYYTKATSIQPGQTTVLDQDKLEADFDLLRTAIDGIDDCFSTVDHTMRRVAPTLATVSAPDANSRAYAIAHKLAGRGSNLNELMRDCGLTRGEAQLVVNLNSGSAQRSH
jgi:hypothetical protein